ncbi:MAG TPA: c-type cytochrome, partial [Xanthomonadales bacterium]|nr:c-type cytochrome [Xanthomonadales bacterium]
MSFHFAKTLGISFDAAVVTVVAAFFLGLASTAAAADLARGEEIFAANCASCHGVGGSPDPDSPL